MWRYLLTSKSLKYGLILTIVGALGFALFGVFRIAAFAYYGPITLPYTTPIDDLSAILFFGSIPLAELIALRQWHRLQREQERIVKTETIQEEITPTPVAVPAVANLVFVDHEATLILGDAVAQLPPTKNEHCFCRAMFKYRINEPVDWSLPYEEMTGDSKYLGVTNQAKARRMVYDTCLAVNARAKQNLGIDDLFVWQDKTIKRTK